MAWVQKEYRQRDLKRRMNGSQRVAQTGTSAGRHTVRNSLLCMVKYLQDC